MMYKRNKKNIKIYYNNINKYEKNPLNLKIKKNICIKHKINIFYKKDEI